MKVIKAKSAGFCFGVSNAVNTALNAARDNTGGGNLYTLGELIHNPSVVADLEKRGVQLANSVEEIETGSVIIRSHGVGKAVLNALSNKGIKVIDATCPYVKSIHAKVEKYYQKGYQIVIVGDVNHPEVIGVNGWCEDSAVVTDSPQYAAGLRFEQPVCIVAQTTIVKSLFEDVCAAIQKNHEETIVFNTICAATSLRQEEAAELAQLADAMIVIGGNNSSNTKKLTQICKEKCGNVFHIETYADMNMEELKNCGVVGITAGASTPAQIIMEVIKKMENTLENFEQSIENFKQLRTGDIVEGTVLAVNENEVFLNIGYKSDGIIKKSDYLKDLYDDLTQSVAVGDKVEAMILDMNDGMGNVVLSKIKVDEIAAFDVAEEKFNSQEILDGKITKIVKGGMIVDLGFTNAFMPANQYDLRYTKDLNVLLGKEVRGRIIEFDKSKNRIIFSRRVVLQEELDARRAEELQKKTEAVSGLEVGAIVSGPIKNITDFGIFIDLGGVDGFVHVSDLSWSRVSNPKNFCKVGDVVEAVVTELDQEKFKVKLSIKNMTREPWSLFLDTYKVGDVVDVKIKNIAKFGAFAEIIPTVEGLIHISNLSHEKVGKVEDVVNTGDVVKVKIIEIDQDKKKIALSIKDLSDPPKKKIEREKLYYKEDNNVTMAEVFSKYLK
jgi:4-hydroxy-3-methylbut-2-enyl diphosphate reductase